MTEEVIEKDYWDIADEELRDEGSGGLGLVGLVKIEFGFKVMVKGFPTQATWFPFVFDPKDKTDEKRALAEAKGFIDGLPEDMQYRETNGEKRKKIPTVCLGMTVIREKVLTDHKDRWQSDQLYATPKWTEGWKTVIKPAMRAVGIPGQGEYWLNIKWIADPTGKKHTDNAGKERENLIAYPALKFASESDALQWLADNADKSKSGVDQSPAQSESPADDTEQSGECPSGYTPVGWAQMIPEIKKDLAAEGADRKKIADDYGVPINWIVKVAKMN